MGSTHPRAAAALRGRPGRHPALGEKKSGAHYTDDDLQLLDTLVHQAALALTNARAYEIIQSHQGRAGRGRAPRGGRRASFDHRARHPQPDRRHPRRGAGAPRGRRRRSGDRPRRSTTSSPKPAASSAAVRSILDFARPGIDQEAMPDDPRGHAASLRRLDSQRAYRATRPSSCASRPTCRASGFDAVQLAEVLEIPAGERDRRRRQARAHRHHRGARRRSTSAPMARPSPDDGPGMTPAGPRNACSSCSTPPSQPGTGVGLATGRSGAGERQAGAIARPPARRVTARPSPSGCRSRRMPRTARRRGRRARPPQA